MKLIGFLIALWILSVAFTATMMDKCDEKSEKGKTIGSVFLIEGCR